MVQFKEIQASNALINDATAPGVAVFVGGTSGIGQLTIRALVALGASIRIYLVGRKSSAERAHDFIQELQTTNPKAQIVWTEGEVALLAETKRICEIIRRKESRIDLLFLTAGYAPFGTRQVTAEGNEVAQSLEYYGRMLFILNLLPLLSKSEAPRVISVLGGGLERYNAVNLDDFDLKKPGNFSFLRAQMQYSNMNTITLEKLADDNPEVTFIHSWPGSVNTGNVRRGIDPGSIVVAWLIWLILEPLIYLFSMTDHKAEQRNLFQCTSAAFGGHGVPWKGKPGKNTRGEVQNGLFLVSYKCDCTMNAGVVPLFREKAREKLWDHTQEVLRPYL